MKYAKILSLGLVVFTLLGCNQPPLASQKNTSSEASNTLEKENYSRRKVATNVENKTITQGKESKTGKLIGGAFDCDNDGKADDSRIDYDGDGIPDDCLVNNEDEIEPLIDESSYETVMNSLQLLAGDCKETQKIQENFKYTVCKLGNKPVKASESHNELGDGLGFWFVEGKVIAVQKFHTGETFVFNFEGNLTSAFADNPNTGKFEKLKSIPDKERKFIEETLRDGYKDIFKVFNL